jgi:hypothetical protein
MSWMTNTSDIFLGGQTQLNEGKHSDFSVLHCTSQWSMLPPKKTVAMIFPADDTLLTFFFLGCYGTIPLIAARVSVKNCGPRFHLTWQFVTKSPHLLHICTKDQWQLLSLWTCQHSWHPNSTDLDQPSSSITAITLPLPVERVEYNSSIVIWWSWLVSSST